MIIKELIEKLLDYDLNLEILIHRDCVIQGANVTVKSNVIKNIVQATGEYPKKYIIINCEYDNCHNVTCKRKCRKDGYEHAIDDFIKSEDYLMEKIKEEKAEVNIDYEWRNVVCLDDIRRMLHQGLLETAGQLKAGDNL